MALTNKKYDDAISEVIDEIIAGVSEKERIKNMVEKIIEAEKSYEFSDERPKIKGFLDSLIK